MKIAGIGFRQGATAVAILDALHRAGGRDVTAIALPADKAGDAAVRQVAEALKARLLPIAPERLAGVQTPTQSTVSLQVYGTGSVAEACALIAAGPGAQLGAPRVISQDRMATAAVAQPAGGGV